MSMLDETFAAHPSKQKDAAWNTVQELLFSHINSCQKSRVRGHTKVLEPIFIDKTYRSNTREAKTSASVRTCVALNKNPNYRVLIICQ